MAQSRKTAAQLAEAKARGGRLACLTCYDYPMAAILEEEGTDLILVGDSLGNTVLGYETTLPVTMDEMLHHARAVVRGTHKTHVCMDMPFLSFQPSPRDALVNAGRAVKEAGVQSVKLEGGRRVAETVTTLVEAGIPVLGHLGYLPQLIHVTGQHQVRDTAAVREELMADALALQEAGCFAIVLEVVPPSVARELSEALHVPTIGIGSGPHCDGQILVLYDMLGLGEGRHFRHVRRYAELQEIIGKAVGSYVRDVHQGSSMPEGGAGEAQ